MREGPVALCCFVLYCKHNQVVSHDAVHPDTGTNSVKNGSLWFILWSQWLRYYDVKWFGGWWIGKDMELRGHGTTEVQFGTERSLRSWGTIWNWEVMVQLRYSLELGGHGTVEVQFGTERSWHNWGTVWNGAVIAQLRYNLELRGHGAVEVQFGTGRSWYSWGTVWNWEVMAQLKYSLELRGHGAAEVQIGTERLWRIWGTISTFMLKGWGKGRTSTNASCPDGDANQASLEHKSSALPLRCCVRALLLIIADRNCCIVVLPREGAERM